MHTSRSCSKYRTLLHSTRLDWKKKSGRYYNELQYLTSREDELGCVILINDAESNPGSRGRVLRAILSPPGGFCSENESFTWGSEVLSFHFCYACIVRCTARAEAMSGDLEGDKKSLHAVDWVIIAVYFILCLAIGLYVSIINGQV